MTTLAETETMFKSIGPEEVPPGIAITLLGRSRLFILPEDAPRSIAELAALRTLAHPNGDVTYLADQVKTYSQGDTEQIIHIIDASSKGEVIGEGEVRYNPVSNEDYFKDKPFVGWTSTVGEHRHEGLATRRLLVMRLAASAEFGLALHSDTLFCDDSARKAWERMVQEGLAQQYLQKTSSGSRYPRYKFI